MRHPFARSTPALPTRATLPDSSSGAPAMAGRKHSVIIDGRKTSISLDAHVWKRLCALAARRRLSVTALIGTIESNREGRNRSRAICAFVEAQKLNDRLANIMIGDKPAHAPKPLSVDDILIR